MSTKKVRVDTKYIPFSGGMDTETSRVAVKSGHVRTSKNVYQGVTGGYRTMSGHERWDGRVAPHLAIYAILTTTLTGAVSVGDIVTDDTAAAFGTVIVNGTTFLAITKITGVFLAGNIKIGAAVVGTCTGPQVNGSAGTTLLDAQYKNLAADVYRADITAPTGSGAIRGVWWLKGLRYCFRNNAGGTACDMWVGSSGGWSQVSLGKKLAFTSGGAYEVLDGDTIVGEISGATAVVSRVVLQANTWAAGTAIGLFVFASQTGVFQAETVRVGANLNVASIAANSSSITLTAGGHYEFVTDNFTASQDTQKMYGCNGVDTFGFEFDGTTFVPIETGMTVAPSHVYVHKLHLFFAFLGSVQHSRPGFPYEWDPIFGSDEIGMGARITGFIAQPGSDGTSALAIFTASDTSILYGSGVADWSIVGFKQNMGGIEWSPQFIGQTVFLDNRGVTSLSAAQTYGNFTDSTLSFKFTSYLDAKKNQVTASCVSREKNLYMLFFADATAIFCTVVGGKLQAGMEMELNHTVTSICSVDDGSGNEIIFFGDSDGMVYELFQGTSDDGEPVAWYMDLVYDSLGSPTFDKHFLMATLEVNGTGYAAFEFGYSLEYESPYVAQPSLEARTITLGPVYWGAFTWGQFFWDGESLTPEKFPVMGVASNIGLKFVGSSEIDESMLFQGVLIQYYLTRSKR